MGSMLKEMMGQKPGGQKPGGQKPGQEPGNQPGNGGSGDNDKANEDINGDADRTTSERRIPKKAGPAGAKIPSEFRRAVEAYRKSKDKKPPTH